MGPYVTYFRRVHRITGYVGPVPHLLAFSPPALQYLPSSVHRMLTVLHATQLGTLGITGPHNRTYPEYSRVVSCVVLCYAVGVLCYAVLVALYAAMYPYPKYSKYHTCATTRYSWLHRRATPSP